MSDTLTDENFWTFQIGVQYDYMRGCFVAYITGDRGSERYALTGMQLEPVDEGGRLPVSPVKFDHGTAQRIMDDLWNAGVRPSGEYARHEGLKAKDAHIDDLRTVLFKAMDIGESE